MRFGREVQEASSGIGSDNGGARKNAPKGVFI